MGLLLILLKAAILFAVVEIAIRLLDPMQNTHRRQWAFTGIISVATIGLAFLL